MTASKVIIHVKMKDYRVITEFLREAAGRCVRDGHHKQHHQGFKFVCMCGLSEKTSKNKMIKTYSCDSNVLIWVEVDPDLTCVWPGLGRGHAWAQIPMLHSHIFVTAGQGRRPSHLRPSQIHNISHCASISPGFPLWPLTKKEDG